MYLLWFIAICIITAYIFEIYFKMDFADSIGISQLGIIVILFICYVIDILQLGIILIGITYISSFVFALVMCRRQGNLSLVTKSIFKGPFLAYIIFLSVVYFVVRTNAVTRGDDLCYWASLPKVLFQYNGALQLNNGFQTHCVDYVPAMPLYMYFLQKINGFFDDGILFFGYAALTGALLLPAGKKFHNWGGIIGLSITLWLIPLFFYSTGTNDSAIFYRSLYVDPVLGISVGCFIWLFMKAPWKRLSSWIQFILYACFISLLKSSGIAFVFIAILVLIIYLTLYEKKVLKNWWIWTGIIFPFVLYFIWHIAMGYFQINNTIDYHILSIIDFGFIKTFANTLVKESLLTPYITVLSKYCTFTALFLLLAVISIFLMRLQIKNTKGQKTSCCLIQYTYFMVYIQCVIYIIGLYALCVGSWNYQLLSFRRYICVILEMLVCFIGCNILYDIKDLKKTIKQKRIYKLICSFLAILVVLIAPLKKVEAGYYVYPEYVYEDYNNLCCTLTAVKSSANNQKQWSRVLILIDEEGDAYETWAKAFYIHVKDHLAYTLISSDIQVSHDIHYTSQLKIKQNGNSIICELPEGETWAQSDYILWCHGDYPDRPITSWELYQTQEIEMNKMSMELINKGNRSY